MENKVSRPASLSVGMIYTQVIRLALRLKSELADDVRRRFKIAPDGGDFKLSPPASGGRALSSAKKAVAFFALESCAAHI
mgnify:CR=1 FL=1